MGGGVGGEQGNVLRSPTQNVPGPSMQVVPHGSPVVRPPSGQTHQPVGGHDAGHEAHGTHDVGHGHDAHADHHGHAKSGIEVKIQGFDIAEVIVGFSIIILSLLWFAWPVNADVTFETTYLGIRAFCIAGMVGLQIKEFGSGKGDRIEAIGLIMIVFLVFLEPIIQSFHPHIVNTAMIVYGIITVVFNIAFDMGGGGHASDDHHDGHDAHNHSH